MIGISTPTFCDKALALLQSVRDDMRVEYGDERNPELREWMDESSALANVQRIRKPLLVLQVRGFNSPLDADVLLATDNGAADKSQLRRQTKRHR